jgi:hypothetical protein
VGSGERVEDGKHEGNALASITPLLLTPGVDTPALYALHHHIG